MSDGKGTSRRSFLKGSVIAGAGALAAQGGLAAAQETTSALPAKWDYEADVVVLGLGYAGASAAITAKDAGADVLILEKAAEDTEDEKHHWPNSRVCGGYWVQVMDPEPAIEFLKAISGELVAPDDMLEVWAEAMSHNDEFIESLGGTPLASDAHFVGGYEHTTIEGHEAVGASVLDNGEGQQARTEQLYQLFMTNVKEREIPILWATPAEALYTDCTGQVVGVKAVGEDGEVNVKARQAVVLATGGYENNAEMLWEYNLGPEYHFIGPPGHDGDGINMALAVGADLWHMKAASAGAAVWYEGMAAGLVPLPLVGYGGKSFTIVDSQGHRFCNDNLNVHNGWFKLTVFDPDSYSYLRVPSYMIFDDALLDVMPAIMPSEYVEWDEDNMATAETFGELAEQIGIDPDTLEATMAAYNEACEAGEGDEFGKAPENMVPVATGPFYAVAIYPGGPNTQGGPRRNAQAQVVRPDGTPIPRLYSAGELGSLYGIQYPGGGNVGECFAFGQIAGRNAAAEEPLGAGTFMVVR